VFKGNVNVGTGPAGGARVETYHTAVFSANQEESGVALAADGEAELVIIAGEPLDQPVVQYGPFVMTSTEEIRKTILDCQSSSCFARSACEADLGMAQTGWGLTGSRRRGRGRARLVGVESAVYRAAVHVSRL
jgi:hypothetical protein